MTKRYQERRPLSLAKIVSGPRKLAYGPTVVAVCLMTLGQGTAGAAEISDRAIAGAAPSLFEATAPKIEVNKNTNLLPLSRRLEWAEDSGGELSVSDLYTRKGSGEALEFHRVDVDSPHFGHLGYTNSAIWARGTIVNTSRQRLAMALEIDSPLIDHIDLYLKRHGRYWEKRTGGDALPFPEREFKHRNVAFAVDFAPGETIGFAARFKSTSSLQLPLKIWRIQAYVDHLLTEQIGYGCLFGVLIMMVLYNFFLFLPTRDRSYLYYCVFIANGILALGALSGHGFQYLWPRFPAIQQPIVPFAIGAWIPLATFFTRSFLRTRERARRIDRVLIFLIISSSIAALSAIVLPVRPATSIVMVLSFFASFATIAAGISVWRNGFSAARFFIIAWTFFTLGVIIYGLKSTAVLPSNFLTHHVLNAGTTLEAIFISMALGDYINTLRTEQELARKAVAERVANQAANMVEIRDSAQFLSEVARSMSDVMERLGRSSRNVSDALTEANAAIYEVQKTASCVSDNAMRIAGESNARVADFDRGRHAMDSTSDAIQRVRSESENIAKMSSTLFKHVEKVDHIIGLVRSVSEQSKVLSVNASIEAAKAAEFGKGFGVIAMEVNALAQESTEATTQVAELLASIRSSLGTIVEATHHGARQTKEGAAAVDSAQTVIRQVREGMTENAVQANQIATSTSEQKDAMTSMIAVMERIAKTADENLEATSAMSKASADVNQTVYKLRDLVKSWSAT